MLGMKAFVVAVLTVSLYLVTALVTGLHNFYWLMDMVNGAPLNFPEPHGSYWFGNARSGRSLHILDRLLLGKQSLLECIDLAALINKCRQQTLCCRTTPVTFDSRRQKIAQLKKDTL